MFLHKDERRFVEIGVETAQYNGMSLMAIRKDYYVTRFLSLLTSVCPKIVFKGGTCLSKCYKVIQRFSEDVDLSYENDGERLTEGMKKNLKKEVLRCASEADLLCLNLDQTRSRRDFNRYEFAYPGFRLSRGLSDSIIVETAVFQASFPTERKPAASMIGEFLVGQGRFDEIDRYGLQPFKVTVQTLERTFIDKVFAICDYYEAGATLRNSRHVYDLYKLYPLVAFDDAFAQLIERVRAVRRTSERCVSAREGYRIDDALAAIEAKRVFEDDYRRVTSYLLVEQKTYEDVASVLQRIRALGLF